MSALLSRELSAAAASMDGAVSFPRTCRHCEERGQRAPQNSRHTPRKAGSSTPRLFDSIINVSGILDRPAEPVIGLAKGETRWRTMTVVGVARCSKRHCERSEAIHDAAKEAGLLRRLAPRNDVET
jgi:hypothetical protein